MGNYTAPGSYVEETTFGSKPTSGVATAIGGFVTVTEKGDLDKLIEVTSWNDYVDKCGERLADYNGGHGVYGFFQNGGKRAFIKRATHFSGGVTTAVKASVTLKDRTNTSDTLKIEGASEGTWAEALTISTDKSDKELSSFSYLRSYDASDGTYATYDTNGRYENIYKVLTYTGLGFTDQTTSAKAESPTAFDAFNDIGDYLAVGSKYNTFGHITIDTPDNSAVRTGIVVVEYFNGLAWQQLQLSTDDLSCGTAVSFDNTASSNNDIVFPIPSDWKKCELNSILAYWIRIKVTTAFTVATPGVKKIQINPPSAGSDKQFAPFPSSIEVGDCFYVGAINTKFDALETMLQVASSGSSPANTVEYWGGTSWKTLTITESVAGVKDFTVEGSLFWDIPADWYRTTINDVVAYWIRFRVTTAPTSTNPSIYSVLSCGSKFKITVKKNGEVVKIYDPLSMSSSSKYYVETILNEGLGKSKWIRATCQTNALTDKRPILTVDAQLTGGDDGLDGLTDSDYIGSSSYKNGLYGFDSNKEVRLLAIPDKAGNADVMGSGLAYAENRKDCYFFVDCASGLTPEEAKTFKQLGGSFNSSYGCMYYPWGKVVDPTGAGSSPRRYVPPSGHMMGVTARVHQKYGVWQVPAGDIAKVEGFLGLEYDTADSETVISLLNPEGINVIVNYEDLGIVSWGGRNLITTDTNYKYQSARHITTFIRNTLLKDTRFAAFKPNNQSLWKKLYNIGFNLLYDLWSKGALFDGGSGKYEDAFFAICDGSLNTREVVKEGKVLAQFGYSLTNPAEFVVLTIGQWDGGSIAEESTVSVG